MPRQKRRYIPKVRGCYECSQRRINCDRVSPRCGKCSARGIVCSGLGTRYRFHLGNKWATGVNQEKASHNLHSSNIEPSSPRQASPARRLLPELNTPQITRCILIPNPDAMTSENEFFFDYFSKHIAREMVAIDDSNNGWRHLMLPIGHIDSLVMNAILATSMFHFAGNGHPDFATRASSLYMRTIAGLKRRQDLNTCDTTSKQRVLLALLILLAAVQVNGWSDFPHIFQMMQLAFNILGGEEALVQGELGEFLLREVRKMRVYAVPFISRTEGARIVRYQAAQSFECLRFYSRLYPSLSPQLSAIARLIHQAYRIYLQRASAHPDPAVSRDLVDQFRTMLESLPPDALGHNVLVWATYVGASESSTPDHRKFFTEFLMQIQRRSGFHNIIRGLKHLEQIWSRSETEDWTAILPEFRILVM